ILQRPRAPALSCLLHLELESNDLSAQLPYASAKHHGKGSAQRAYFLLHLLLYLLLQLLSNCGSHDGLRHEPHRGNDSDPRSNGAVRDAELVLSGYLHLSASRSWEWPAGRGEVVCVQHV